MANYPGDNIVGKVKINTDLLGSDLWERAKREYDLAAARQVVESMWSPEKTAAFAEKAHKDLLLITQPSTSKKNVVPVALAEKLSRETGLNFIIGDEFFNSRHSKEAKNMSRLERIFNRREYNLCDPDKFREIVGGKKLVIVEDVLTSGGSVASFCNELKRNNFDVVAVVALMGDRRLAMDKITQERLQKTLDEKDLPFSAGDLAKVLTRTEAGYLIMNLNNIRSENGKRKFAGKIQGLFDQGFIAGVGRDPNTGRNAGPQRRDRGDERPSKDLSLRNVQRNPKHGAESAVERLRRRRQNEKTKGLGKDR